MLEKNLVASHGFAYGSFSVTDAPDVYGEVQTIPSKTR